MNYIFQNLKTGIKIPLNILCRKIISKINFYTYYYNMNINSLDLNNDFLEIIYVYVKKDNHDEMKNKRSKQMLKEDLFNYVDNEMGKMREWSKNKYICRGDSILYHSL